VCFSYSPDGKRVAWLRTFPGEYDEIIIHTLATGAEEQITHDHANIDELVWTRENSILYTTNKEGVYNVWMVPVTGGAPIRITKGRGPDQSVRASSDGQKVLFSQNQDIRNLWMGDLTKMQFSQLTSNDGLYGRPTFSRDQKLIAFHEVMSTVYPQRTILYTMDLTTGERRKMTSDSAVSTNPVFSPDGQWIAYAHYPIYTGLDSVSVYAVKVDKPGEVRRLGRGCPVGWIDPQCLIAWDGAGSLRTYLDGRTPERIGGDSIWIVPSIPDTFILYIDRHIGKYGLWARTPSKKSEVQQLWADTKRADLEIWGDFAFHFTQSLRWFMLSPPWSPIAIIHQHDNDTAKEGWWKMELATLKKTPLVGPLKCLVMLNGDLSADANHIVYTEGINQAKYVLIEHLFK
jgi:Tol biopolymer transport system component